MVTGLLSMMLAWDTGTAAEAEAVIAIAAGAKSAKITLRIGHSFSLNVTFLSSAQTSLRVETRKYKLNRNNYSPRLRVEIWKYNLNRDYYSRHPPASGLMLKE
jgi:hypothetical protein